jgi:hypothetical protein
LPKSGSALFFNLTNDLLIASGGQNVRSLRDEFNLHDFIKYDNCNIEDLTTANLQRLYALHEQGYCFAVKTHSGPSDLAKKMSRDSFQFTCICRDPRDIVISALAHGKKIRMQGLEHTFASCRTVSDTITRVESWICTFMDWLEMNPLHICRFEDLLSSPLIEMRRLQRFLGLDQGVDLQALWECYQGQGLSRQLENQLHFNVGIAGRFRSVLSDAEVNECNVHFRPFLERFDYML